MNSDERDRALHALMREAKSRRSQMRAALERLCNRAVPAPVSPDDVLKALVDILYGRGVPGIRRSHVGAAEGRRARAFRRGDEKQHPGSRPEWHGYAHRAKAPEDQLMRTAPVSAAL